MGAHWLIPSIQAAIHGTKPEVHIVCTDKAGNPHIFVCYTWYWRIKDKYKYLECPFNAAIGIEDTLALPSAFTGLQKACEATALSMAMVHPKTEYS